MQTKKIRLLLLSITLLFSPKSFGQISVSSTIVDESNIPIPYVNIGIIEQGIGTVSNREGGFELIISETLSSHEIHFSHIGYKSLNIKVKEIPQTIVLIPFIKELETITVAAPKYHKKELGNHSKSGLLISGFSNGDYGGEVGRKFSINQVSIIEKFGFYVKHNSFDSVVFRLKIYTVDRKLPGKLLSGENLIIVKNRTTGQKEIKLKVPVEVEEDIIVTLELVEHFPLQKGYIYFSQSPPYLGKMYYRETSFDRVKKYLGGPMSMYLSINY